MSEGRLERIGTAERRWLARCRSFCFSIIGLIIIGSNPIISVSAQVPNLLGYQGRIAVDGVNFTGPGLFKFALGQVLPIQARTAKLSAKVLNGFLVDIAVTDSGAGYTLPPTITITDTTGSGAVAVAELTDGSVKVVRVLQAGSGYSATPKITTTDPDNSFRFLSQWSNDNTSVEGSEPVASVRLDVRDGLFSVLLGDTNLAGMQPVPPAVFAKPDIQLRVWFNDGTHGFSALAPDQRVAAVGYAMIASQIVGSQTQTVAFETPVTFNPATGAPFTVRSTATVNNLSADRLDGLDAAAFWKTGGNAGTSPGTDFLGTADLQPLQLHVNGTRAFRIEPNTNGAPNLIGGAPVNFVGPRIVGAVIGGGGATNQLGRSFTNRVEENFGVVSGGADNRIEQGGLTAVIGGGEKNRIGSASGVVAGGFTNVINRLSAFSVIAGGHENAIDSSAPESSIGGGFRNRMASGASLSVIAGGTLNTNRGDSAVIAGGSRNAIEGAASFASLGGGLRNRIGTGAEGAVISGGGDNTTDAEADLAVIGGGDGNLISTNANFSTIGGGKGNQILADTERSTIIGGFSNLISTNVVNSTISGGFKNRIESSSDSSSVGGGAVNVIGVGSDFSVISGGTANLVTNSADLATIPGGKGARADSFGQLAYASGPFRVDFRDGPPGSAQGSQFVLRNLSTTTSFTELFLDGGENNRRMVIPRSASWLLDALIIGRRAGGSTVAFQLRGVVKNVGNTVTLVGVPQITQLGLSNDIVGTQAEFLAAVELTGDSATSSVRLRARSLSGSSVRWVATVRTAEVRDDL